MTSKPDALKHEIIYYRLIANDVRYPENVREAARRKINELDTDKA